MIVDATKSHEQFRASCGGGRLKADKSWQGLLSEKQMKALSFISVVVYNPSQDKSLCHVLKATTHVGEILTHEPFKAMIQEILDEVQEPPHGESNQVLAPVEDDLPPGAVVSLSDLDITENMARSCGEELQAWLEQAQTHKDRFVRLVVSPDSATTLAELLQATVMGNFTSTQDGKCALWYDAKLQGEISAQPHIRQPSFDKVRFKQIVQGWCKARTNSDEDAKLSSHGGGFVVS